MKFGSISNRGKETLLQSVLTVSRAYQFPVRWVPGPPSPGLKRAGLEADHTPSIAEVKNEWSYAMPPLFHTPTYRAEGLHIKSYIRSGFK
jgi:hypothetical protein